MPERVFSDDELTAIEREHSDGLSSEAIVGFLRDKGIKLTGATLRKLVQLGLLPRSRRVGLRGGQPGSLGLYPVTVVRRIQLLRAMMEQHTIEEIRKHAPFARGDVDELEESLERIIGRLKERGDGASLEEARRRATHLVAALRGLDRRPTDS